MSVLSVPDDGTAFWPTLGADIVAWMEANLVFGPGDLRGQPYRLDDEKVGLVYRLYEVHPHGTPNAGRRRFRRAGLSLRKGSAKTELGAAIAAVELAADGPVRSTGWRKEGRVHVPVGGPVTDPYIPMLAYTEEQSEELAYAALYVMLSEGPLADRFDFGLQRVMRVTGDGKAAALATAPDSRDGARTTFELFDETHRLVLPRQKEAHRTMLANLPKRRLADPWALEVTTAPAPGEGSVAENTMDYAREVASGRIPDARLFFFHRQASEDHDLTTREGIRAAVLEASGSVASWSDVDGIVEQWDDPTADRTYLARVWLNQVIRGSDRAFDAEAWKRAATSRKIPAGTAITLGFDGSRTNDATALVATEVESGYQWPLGIWQRPANAPEDWEVPADEVDETVAAAFERYRVKRMYADPTYWSSEVRAWIGRYGKDVVAEWPTYRNAQMSRACRAYTEAVSLGLVSHDGSPLFAEHIGNTQKRYLQQLDEDGNRQWVMQKERQDSPHKIDAAMAGCLSWEARGHALTTTRRTMRAFAA